MKKLKTDSNKILLIGIGNCGRGDDGLGWKFADYFQQKEIALFDIEYRYQLQVEDAELISRYDIIVFADASHIRLKDGFELKPCKATEHYFYSSHMQSPATILFLAKCLYGKLPDAFTMAISGAVWELKNSLGSKAQKNLHSSIIFFENNFIERLQYRVANQLY